MRTSTVRSWSPANLDRFSGGTASAGASTRSGPSSRTGGAETLVAGCEAEPPKHPGATIAAPAATSSRRRVVASPGMA